MSAKKPTTPVIKLQRLSDLAKVKFVTSGIPEIDELTGGFPRGRITEVYGKTGVGKTSLMSMCIAELSKKHKVLFIDAENALNKDRFVEMGGNADKVSVTTEYVLENVADIVIDSIGKFDVIVVDSVAALTAKTEYEGETGAANIGIKAKLMHQWMRRIIGKLGKSKCALVFINQLRDSLDMYTPAYTTGGSAIDYASSLRIQLSNNKSDRTTSGGEFNGTWVHVEITKSKVSKPYAKTKFKLDF
jgi:recombination protein RecA